MAKTCYVRWFDSIRLEDLPEVGGKNASLDELHALLAVDGGRVPDGFALSARAYCDALDGAGAWEKLRLFISGFDHHDVALLGGRRPSPSTYLRRYSASPTARCRRTLTHLPRHPRSPSNALPQAGLLVEAISSIPLKSVFSARRFTEEGYENTLVLCVGVQLAM
jgi:hypothetical protein